MKGQIISSPPCVTGPGTIPSGRRIARTTIGIRGLRSPGTNSLKANPWWSNVDCKWWCPWHVAVLKGIFARGTKTNASQVFLQLHKLQSRSGSDDIHGNSQFGTFLHEKECPHKYFRDIQPNAILTFLKWPGRLASMNSIALHTTKYDKNLETKRLSQLVNDTVGPLFIGFTISAAWGWRYQLLCFRLNSSRIGCLEWPARKVACISSGTRRTAQSSNPLFVRSMGRVFLGWLNFLNAIGCCATVKQSHQFIGERQTW